MKASELHARASAEFASKLAHTEALLKQVARDHAPAQAGTPPQVKLACSLGAEDMVLVHLVNALRLDISVFVLDTGRLHAQTQELLHLMQEGSRAPVQVYKPQEEAVVQFVRTAGEDAMYRSIELRKACCQIRKMEPLERALAGQRAWITGLRREQSGARAEVPFLDSSDARRLKVNPLADWTWGDVWHYIQAHQVPYNPLHDQFFPSIGCEPCTRAIAVGEDFRAGRWWWESEGAKECGLHVPAPRARAADASPGHRHGAVLSAQAPVGSDDVTPAGRIEAQETNLIKEGTHA